MQSLTAQGFPSLLHWGWHGLASGSQNHGSQHFPACAEISSSLGRRLCPPDTCRVTGAHRPHPSCSPHPPQPSCPALEMLQQCQPGGMAQGAPSSARGHTYTVELWEFFTGSPCSVLTSLWNVIPGERAEQCPIAHPGWEFHG